MGVGSEVEALFNRLAACGQRPLEIDQKEVGPACGIGDAGKWIGDEFALPRSPSPQFLLELRQVIAQRHIAAGQQGQRRRRLECSGLIRCNTGGGAAEGENQGCGDAPHGASG